MRIGGVSWAVWALVLGACGGGTDGEPSPRPDPVGEDDPTDDPADDPAADDDPADPEDDAPEVDPADDGDEVVPDPHEDPDEPNAGLDGEPNDDPAHASPLAPGEDAPGSIDPAGDDDWYSIDLDAGQTLSAETSDGHGGCGLDTVVFVYDGVPDPVVQVGGCADDPSAVACDDDGGVDFCSLATWTATRGGRHYVRVAEYGDDGTGDYVLRLTVSDGPRVEPEGEPNDDLGHATPLRDGSVIGAAIDAIGDDDWYSIVLGSGNTAVFETSDGQGGCDLDTVLVLYGDGAEPLVETWSCNDDPAEIFCDDDRGPGDCSRLYFTAPYAGTFYVRAIERDDDATGAYQLRVDVDPALTNRYDCGRAGEIEPNDDMSLAGLVCDGTVVDAAIDAAEEDDWYAVDLDAGETVVAETSNGDGGCDLDTVLVAYDELANPLYDTWSCDDDPSEIACDDDGAGDGCSRLAWTAEDAGTIFLRVLEWNDDQSGAYQLGVSIR